MTWTEKAQELRPYIEKAAVSLNDADAIQAVGLFPVWAAGAAYAAEERVQHNGILYRCVQAHTAQSVWTPDVTAALWAVVSLEEWPEWVQPTGAHDAYALGSKVRHDGQKWVSNVDGNIWEPGAYGWEVVSNS